MSGLTFFFTQTQHITVTKPFLVLGVEDGGSFGDYK